jgi:hypothetical protein
MRDAIDIAREAGLLTWLKPPEDVIERLKRFEALVRADERSAPVHDENQAFIDSLPADSDDKMYMQIHHWARQSYARHKSLVAGQMITAGDASDTHIIWATLRWAKENTPPAAPVPLTPEQIEHLWETRVSQPCPKYPLEKADWVQFARAIEAAHGIAGKGQP